MQQTKKTPAPKPQKIPGKLIAGAALIALLGGGGVATRTMNKVAEYEGYIPQAYQCPAGVWTKCFGSTKDVTPGATYTFEECTEALNADLVELARPVAVCLPGLAKLPDKTKTAIVSMAYNIGPSAFCKSSVAQAFRAGDYERGCKRIAGIYTTAKGKEQKGLVIRRKAESDLCLEGLREGL